MSDNIHVINHDFKLLFLLKRIYICKSEKKNVATVHMTVAATPTVTVIKP